MPSVASRRLDGSAQDLRARAGNDDQADLGALGARDAARRRRGSGRPPPRPDLGEVSCSSYSARSRRRLVLGVVGGQGALFGRGNQQLSPRVLRRIGIGNIECRGRRTSFSRSTRRGSASTPATALDRSSRLPPDPDRPLTRTTLSTRWPHDRTPVHAELDGGVCTGSCSMPSVRPMSRRSSSRSRPRTASRAARPAAGARLRGGPSPPPARPARAQRDCERNLSFLGGGIWQHHVPAIVDEIARRSEFLTPVWGTPSSDHGRNQAWFEFASQLGELIEMDFVGLPVYSWGCAAGHAIRMAARLTGAARCSFPANLDPERLAVIQTYCGRPSWRPHLEVVPVGHRRRDGLPRPRRPAREALAGHRRRLLRDARLPRHLERRGGDRRRARARARRRDDRRRRPDLARHPRAARRYGADIVVGSEQPLGVHMYCGGGVGGFIATRDEERYAREYPTLNLSIAPDTRRGRARLRDRAVRADLVRLREHGNDWTGNSVYL